MQAFIASSYLLKKLAWNRFKKTLNSPCNGLPDPWWHGTDQKIVYLVRVLAMGGGGNRPGRRVEGAPMTCTTISTKLLLYRMNFSLFPKNIIINRRYWRPHIDKKQIRSATKYGNFGSRRSPTTGNSPTKTLIRFYIAKFCDQFKRFLIFLLNYKFFGGWGEHRGEGCRGGGGRQTDSLRPGRQKPSLRLCTL